MIQIRVVSVDGRPPSSPMMALFGPAGGTIGRSDGNALVLPDEAKTVSRQHAVVQVQAGQFVLLDKGANPTLRNRVPVGPTQIAPLTIGDELRIGPYVLLVESPFDPASDPDAAAQSGRDLAGRVFTPAAPVAAAEPKALLAAAAASVSTLDPFALPHRASPSGTPPGAQGGPTSGVFAPQGHGGRRPPPPIPFEQEDAQDALRSPGEHAASIDSLFGLGSAPADPLDVLGRKPGRCWPRIRAGRRVLIAQGASIASGHRAASGASGPACCGPGSCTATGHHRTSHR